MLIKNDIDIFDSSFEDCSIKSQWRNLEIVISRYYKHSFNLFQLDFDVTYISNIKWDACEKLRVEAE